MNAFKKIGHWLTDLWRKIIGHEPSTPATPPVTPPATPPQADVNTFLWKPVSDSYGGRAVALLPANIDARQVTANGEVASKHPRANGNRQHFRFSKTGADYGMNVKVIATLTNGGSKTWTVPNGGVRFSA